MSYLTIKTIHIIGAVCWFAGLFYGVRLFVYHAEAVRQSDGEHTLPLLELMARRLWRGIATPAMIVTLVFGIWLLVLYGQWAQGWVHFKLLMLAILTGYHLFCLRILNAQKARQSKWDGQQLRILNEAPTLLLVGIITAAVFKTAMTGRVVAVTLGILAAILALAIWAYKRARMRREAAAE
ncbi:MAG: CopD family protein [Myxococcota bacterium]|nr:CopD family protein [Myxococcota bacterium]